MDKSDEKKLQRLREMVGIIADELDGLIKPAPQGSEVVHAVVSRTVSRRLASRAREAGYLPGTVSQHIADELTRLVSGPEDA